MMHRWRSSRGGGEGIDTIVIAAGNFVIADKGDPSTSGSTASGGGTSGASSTRGEGRSGHKVTGVITAVLFSEHVHALRSTPFWPPGFTDDRRPTCGSETDTATTSSPPNLIDSSAVQIRGTGGEDGNKAGANSDGGASGAAGIKKARQVDTSQMKDSNDSSHCHSEGEEEEDDDDGMPPLEANPNRRNGRWNHRLDEESSSDGEEEDEGGAQVDQDVGRQHL
eukprot:TRINITY_DN5144_c0_g1_i1.p1 TRINITY_DN5144_c0_g1~~TRINITY_DN5144_c0_g1_i1.p1  ORF type:complete len:223 (-),score=48.50 TRINITY_DN5144_c0_g1_i1:374-1042(-)